MKSKSYLYAYQFISAVLISAVMTAGLISSQVSASPSSIQAAQSNERDALVVFYQSTNGEQWTDHSNWLVTDSPCFWYGITCTDGLVTGISLRYNNLTGIIPVEIGNLTNLEVLDLSENLLTGAIPSEIGNLIQLRELWIAYNGLGGTIPTEIGNLFNLTVLSFSGNTLEGSIPPEIGNLTNLNSTFS